MFATVFNAAIKGLTSAAQRAEIQSTTEPRRSPRSRRFALRTRNRKAGAVRPSWEGSDRSSDGGGEERSTRRTFHSNRRFQSIFVWGAILGLRGSSQQKILELLVVVEVVAFEEEPDTRLGLRSAASPRRTISSCLDP